MQSLEYEPAEWSIRRAGTNRSLITQDFWSLNEWQHIVASVDEAGVMKLYSNGEMRASYSGHLPQGVTRSEQFLGKSNWGGDANFKGMMDDLRIYDRALSLNEVSQIFQGDLTEDRILGGEDPLVTRYWGDEDPGTVTEVNASSALAWDAKVILGARTLDPLVIRLLGCRRTRISLIAFLRRIPQVRFGHRIRKFSTGDFSFQPQSIAGGDLCLVGWCRSQWRRE